MSQNERTNRAMRIHEYGGEQALRPDVVPVPAPGPGQVLVRVTAAGVNPLDWKLRDGLMRDAIPIPLPATLGAELAGVVVATGPDAGPDAGAFAVGARVMGPVGGVGAYADFVVVDAARLNAIPDGLGDTQAAALPVAALTAWQALHAAGAPRPGQTVLIHGASGGVGGFAVQFAKAAGATVVATASAASLDHVRGLGADRVIDRAAARFEDTVAGVDLVLDLVGGDTLDRSWQVLAPHGALVSITTFDVAARAPAGRTGVFHAMGPDAARLRSVAEAVAAGTLRSTIAATVGFADIPAAVERNKRGHAPGKTVVDFAR